MEQTGQSMLLVRSGSSFRYGTARPVHDNRHMIPYIRVIGKSKQNRLKSGLAHSVIYP
jgi:hypothetical protein